MPIQGQSIRDTVIYRQDAQPEDTRDGILWVDTSGGGTPETKVYGDGSWGPIGDNPLFVTQEAVTFSETAVNPSFMGAYVASGQVELTNGETSTANNNSNANTWNVGGNYAGVRFSIPNGGIAFDVTLHSGLGSGTLRILDKDYNVLDSTASSGGSTETFTLADPIGTAVAFEFAEDGGGAEEVDTAGSSTYISADSGSYSGGTDSTAYNIMDVTVTLPELAGEAYIEWDPMDEMSAWDIISWNYDKGGGSMTFNVEVDDGTGWSVRDTDVLPPVGIAGVAADSDVRLHVDMSRPSATDTSPAMPYSARRAER